MSAKILAFVVVAVSALGRQRKPSSPGCELAPEEVSHDQAGLTSRVGAIARPSGQLRQDGERRFGHDPEQKPDTSASTTTPSATPASPWASAEDDLGLLQVDRSRFQLHSTS